MYFVPFVPTPYPVVREMLKLAGAGKDDVLYDLGCGDGRILIVAVKEFNVKKAVGIERDSERVKEAVRRINEEGISDKAIVIQGDFFETDISEATIVTLFLLTSVNEVLRPKFENELRDGTRIVSHEFRIPGWKHEKMIEVRDDNGLTHVVYLYVKGRHL
ncbi:protein-lysine N-methyltransferase [Desulfurococcus amylolyticus]|uniref:Putative RNA methylase n=1 Tax=Desulfurococcus amylolyticus DSM 16532 TaxID=768672 RepID=I3XTJ4_DESAM|nr:protein-lysine N-methyltransferase [Desulfurococcus amylolyticus]AFL67268.1 putative RNA methylase [Desulfurococcus amylolyticus DSM 16532]